MKYSQLLKRDSSTSYGRAPEVRNPKGTKPKDMRCKYHHPKYCNKTGHADARSPSCYAKSLSKKERDDVLSIILREAVQVEFQRITVDGTCICTKDFLRCKSLFLFIFADYDCVSEMIGFIIII